jgi:hypothetical protein
MASIRVSPLARYTGLATLKRVELGFLRVTAVALIEVFADLAADDSANDGASHCRRHVAAAFAELIANEPAGDATENHPGALVIYAALPIAAPGKHGNRQ